MRGVRAREKSDNPIITGLSVGFYEEFPGICSGIAAALCNNTGPPEVATGRGQPPVACALRCSWGNPVTEHTEASIARERGLVKPPCAQRLAFCIIRMKLRRVGKVENNSGAVLTDR